MLEARLFTWPMLPAIGVAVDGAEPSDTEFELTGIAFGLALGGAVALHIKRCVGIIAVG